MALEGARKDASLVVWLGIIGLLFLAVAVYEGWIGTGGGGNISGSSSFPSDSGPAGTNLLGGPHTGFDQVDSFQSFLDWLVSV